MKITDTLLSQTRKSLKRKRKYTSRKKQPEISSEDEIVRDLFDDDVLDLTEMSLDDLVEEEREQGLLKISPAVRKKLREDIVGDVLKELDECCKNIKPTKLKKTQLTLDGESLCVLFSDWHYGKVIKTKSGKQVYSSEIASQRIENELVPKILENVHRVGANKTIDEVVIIFAGDIVDNDIVYDTQRFRIDNGVAVQFHGVIRSIMSFIHSLSAVLNNAKSRKKIRIRLECIIGNHGRPSALSKIGVCSWDTAVYSALDLVIKQSKLADHVELSFALEDYKVINVRGHRGLIRHQAPAQSETPSAKKKFGGWYDIFDYDFMCYGDLHHTSYTTYNGKPLLMNGSLCGYDEFAINLGLRDNWAQLMWFANDKDPVTLLQKIS